MIAGWWPGRPRKEWIWDGTMWRFRAVIKPNLVSPTEASWGATTHPEVVEGIIEYLKENGITAMLTDVVALRVPHETGSLSRAMHQIVEGEVNIEYMYAFANGEDASAVLKCDDPARVVDILRGSGFDVWEASEAYVSNIKNAL